MGISAGVGVVSVGVGGMVASAVTGSGVSILPIMIVWLAAVSMMSSDESDEIEMIEIAITCTSTSLYKSLYINHARCRRMNE